MKMHKVSLLAALAAGALIAFIPNLRAEDAPAKPNRPERPEGGPRGGQRGDLLKDMAEKLNLTADQKAKLQEALKAQREARVDLKDATPEERRAKMQENRKAMDAKIKGILTADQYAQWEKIREENRPAGPNGPRKPRGPSGEKPAKQ